MSGFIAEQFVLHNPFLGADAVAQGKIILLKRPAPYLCRQVRGSACGLRKKNQAANDPVEAVHRPEICLRFAERVPCQLRQAARLICRENADWLDADDYAIVPIEHFHSGTPSLDVLSPL